MNCSICLILLSTSMVHKMSTSCTIVVDEWCLLELRKWYICCYILELVLWKCLIQSTKKNMDLKELAVYRHTAEWTVREAFFFLRARINSNHLWNFGLTKHHSKNLSRSSTLLGVHSASVYSEVIAPLQWLLSVDERKALPETYLLSTGQFLCVVMPMIDCKRTHKNDLQQFTCTFLRLEERALDLLCTSFLWQSYNYVGVRGTHGTLTRKLTNISTVRSWDGCIILQVLNLSLYLGENL